MPLDDPGIGKGGYNCCPSLVRQAGRDRDPVFRHPVIKDDIRAERARPLHLHTRRIGRHDDRCLNPEPSRRPGNALRMIAARKRNHAGAPLRVRKVRQPMPGSAQLERADGLERFGLAPDGAPRDLASVNGRRRQHRRNLLIGLLHARKTGLSVLFQRAAHTRAIADTVILYKGDRNSYIACRCPKGTSNNRKAALLELNPFGGPLNCTSTIARWG